MFVDEWPSITWSVLDYDRNPKPGYYALQTAMQPILPGINPTEQPDTLDGRYWVYQSDQLLGFVIWVINDTLNGYPTALLDWQVIDTAKRVVLQGELPISVNPDEAASKTVLRSLQFPPGKYSLLVTLKDPQGQELGNNQLYFEIAQPVVQP